MKRLCDMTKEERSELFESYLSGKILGYSSSKDRLDRKYVLRGATPDPRWIDSCYYWITDRMTVKPRPPWGAFNKEYKYFCVSEGGTAHFSKTRPVMTPNGWQCKGSLTVKIELLDIPFNCNGWRDSLVERSIWE